MKILIGADHAGFRLKEELKELFKALFPKIILHDHGVHNEDRVDYPLIAKSFCESFIEEEYKAGILICGSGIGVSIAANKFKGIRAAHVTNTIEAQLAKEHNDANVICLGGRFLAAPYAFEVARAWVEAVSPDAESRHQRRVDQINSFDK